MKLGIAAFVFASLLMEFPVAADPITSEISPNMIFYPSDFSVVDDGVPIVKVIDDGSVFIDWERTQKAANGKCYGDTACAIAKALIAGRDHKDKPIGTEGDGGPR